MDDDVEFPHTVEIFFTMRNNGYKLRLLIIDFVHFCKNNITSIHSIVHQSINNQGNFDKKVKELYESPSY